QGIYAQHHQHRAEDLLGVGAHLAADLVKDGGANEEAVLMVLDHQIASVNDQGGTGLLGFADDLLQPGLGGRGDDRTHVGLLIQAVGDVDPAGTVGQLVHQRVG